MTQSQFVSNNRGIDRGLDLPQEQLEAMYQRVQVSGPASCVRSGSWLGVCQSVHMAVGVYIHSVVYMSTFTNVWLSWCCRGDYCELQLMRDFFHVMLRPPGN